MKSATLLAAALALVIQETATPLPAHADTTLSGTYAGPPFTFDDPVTLTDLVTLSTPPASALYTFNAPISGPGGLLLHANARLLSSNSFTGGISFDSKSPPLVVADPSSLGAGTVTFNAAGAVLIFGMQTGSTTTFATPVIINSSATTISPTNQFYLAGSLGPAGHTIQLPQLTANGIVGLALSYTTGSPTDRSWTIGNLELNGSLQISHASVDFMLTTNNSGSSSSSLTLGGTASQLPVTINSLHETAPSSLTVASNITLHLTSASTLSGGITNKGQLVADSPGALGSSPITNTSATLTLNSVNAAGGNISGGTLFYNANGAAAGHAITNVALFAGPSVTSLSNGITPDALSGLTSLHGPNAFLATLDRGIGGGSSNVSFTNLAVIEATDAGLPAVQHLGTNADLTLGINLAGPSAQPATLGLGTPWAALSAGTYRGTLTALSDFALSSGTFVSATDSSFSILTPAAQPPVNVTLSVTLSAPLANYSGVSKFLVTSAATLSTDNALGSAPVPIDIASSGNLTVTSPAAINATAFFHQSSTLTIQSPGLTGTGILSRENQPLTIALANPQALTGSQLTGFIHPGDNVLLSADNIQHLSSLDPTVTFQIPATTSTQSGTITLNGGRLQGFNFPATLQGPSGGDLLLNVGDNGATLFGNLQLSARISASGPVNVGSQNTFSFITLNNSGNQFSEGILVAPNTTLTFDNPGAAAGTGISLNGSAISLFFATPDLNTPAFYTTPLHVHGSTTIFPFHIRPQGPLEFAQVDVSGTLTLSVSSTIDSLAAVGTAQLSGTGTTSIGSLTGDSLIADTRLTAGRVQLSSLSLTAGNSLTLTSAAHGPSTLASLSLTNTSTLDLGPSALIINPSANRSSVLSTLISQIKSAQGTGNWKSPGITSNAAIADPAHYALALADNADLALSSFQGTPLHQNSLLLTPAHLGDANLSGIVDIQDQSIITNHWQSAQNNWSSGDLNLDGIVDLQDLTLVTNNWQQSSQFSLSPPLPVSLSSPIPEPSSLLLLTLPLLAMWHSRPRLCRERAHKKPLLPPQAADKIPHLTI